MGAGIAQLAATHGWSASLIDSNAAALERGLAGIAKELQRQVDKGRLAPDQREAALGRIRPSDAIRDLHEAEIAIEAVIENLTVKQEVFSALEDALPAGAILATNTSSLSVTRIADSVSDPSRVIGMHFFNPAVVMPLVEIIAGRQSDAAYLDQAAAIACSWGKTVVHARDTPGFIVNRVARGYYLEALRALGEGIGGVDEIDAVMRTHGGFKMGPFELMDLVGLDVNLAVSTSVWEQMGKPARLAPHPIQQNLVSEGKLGRKTGRGFYRYEDARAVAAYPVDRRSFHLSPLLSETMRSFSQRAGAHDAGSTEQYVFSRILGAIINEAGLALGDGIASAQDIDLAMVAGTNYPKGPLAWAESIGYRTVRGLLSAINEAVPDRRFAPAPVFS